MSGRLDLDVIVPWVRARAGDGALTLRGAAEDADVSTIAGTLDVDLAGVRRSDPPRRCGGRPPGRVGGPGPGRRHLHHRRSAVPGRTVAPAAGCGAALGERRRSGAGVARLDRRGVGQVRRGGHGSAQRRAGRWLILADGSSTGGPREAQASRSAARIRLEAEVGRAWVGREARRPGPGARYGEACRRQELSHDHTDIRSADHSSRRLHQPTASGSGNLRGSRDPDDPEPRFRVAAREHRSALHDGVAPGRRWADHRCPRSSPVCGEPWWP